MAFLKMVAVRDRAANTFARPFCVPSLGVAIRSFTDEINRASGDNPLYAHPEDYDLYQVGVFDEDTGNIEPCQASMIAVGKEMMAKPKEA